MPWRCNRQEGERADGVHDLVGSFDHSPGDFRPMTLMGVFHLIEETGRHVGHMDITRELLDGRVGR